MINSKSLFTGFIVGTAVSAATALLLTPTSGSELRGNIKRQGVQVKNTIEDIVKDSIKLKEQIAKTSKEGATLIKELTEDMKTSVEDWKNTIEPHQNNIHQYLEEIESSIKELEEKMNADKKES